MGYIQGADREQIILFPERLSDLVSDDNPVRVIDAFVEQIDFAKIGIKEFKTLQVRAGRPEYSPKHLLNCNSRIISYYETI